MAINSPIIDAGPTKQRQYVTDQPVQTHPVGPGETYADLVDGFRTVVTVDPPDREGQVFFHVERSEGRRLATMYVGVNFQDTLVWARISTGTVRSTYSGRPWDPINDQ